MHNFWPKHPFFLYFRNHLENGEGNKGDVESKCTRVTIHASKKVAKAEVNLKWPWTIDSFDYIFIYSDDLVYLIPIFSLFFINVFTGSMIFLYLLEPPSRILRAWNLMGTWVRNGLWFFLLFGKNYYFIQRLSFLISILFGNVFQTLGVMGLLPLLYAKLRC